MSGPSFLQEAVETLEQATDKVTAARDLVVDSGGCWCDSLAQETRTLFEIHLFGFAGVGQGAKGAVQNWLDAARKHLSEKASSSLHTLIPNDS